MFNFNLKKSDIYPAIRWEPLFNPLKTIKKISAVFSIILFLLFFYGFFSGYFSYNINKSFLGLLMISVSIYAAALLKSAFFENKIKNPKVREKLEEAALNMERHNIADFLSFESAKAVEKSYTSTHILYFLLKNSKELDFILTRLLLDKKRIMRAAGEYIKELQHDKNSLSESFKNTIIEALKLASYRKHFRIEERDIIFALSKTDPVLKRILIEFDLEEEDINNLSQWMENIKKEINRGKRFWEMENLFKKGSLAKTWTAGYTIALDKYSIDWTEALRKKPFDIIGHEKQIEMTERILSGGGTNNVLLIGEPGVGKKRIIYALAKKSILGQSMLDINYRRVVELDLPSLLAEIEDEEQVETTLDRIFEEAVSAGNVILVIDNFYNYVAREAKPGIVDISGIIAPYLKMPQCQLIGITTYDGLHQNIERNSSLLSLFEKVEVPELSKEETIMFLESLLPDLERKYKKIISYPAIREIVELSNRYMPNSAFPEKAVKLLDDVIVYVSDLDKEKIVLPRHVAKIITEKTEIPVGEIEDSEKNILLNLEGLIHNRIINQEEAVKEISTAMRRARSEITIRKGPIGAFIFLGPTGVGKTETSKALAEVYFGDEEKMIRFDMSEFQSAKDIPRLIGSQNSPGLLTTAVRENPFSVLLLDEIEKADYNIRNLFLQVLDEGYITDNYGKKADFKNTIIIATSNAGYKIILSALKDKTPWNEVENILRDYLFKERIFPPEFLNRFDSVVVFHPLSKDNVFDIAGLMLSKLKKNLKDKGVEFVVSDALKHKIADLGYNEIFGAREMRRVIQDNIENPLASALLSGKLKRGDKVEVNPMNFDLIVNPFN